MCNTFSGLLVVMMSLAAVSAEAKAPQRVEGRFEVRGLQVESPELEELAQAMADSGTLEELAKGLNEMFVLPVAVGLRFSECGEANAYYDPEEREISICVELMAGMEETLAPQYEDEESLADALAGAFVTVVLHEVGHALVDVLEIPVTGREEDAVDQLSAWVLIEGDDTDSVLGAAASYYTDYEAGDEDFADEHSVDKQRYFNLLCWVYGSNPEENQFLVEDEAWELPEERAERCPDEYAQLDRSWSRLLKAHLRDNAGSDPETSAAAPAPPTTRRPEETRENEARYQPPV